MSIPPASTAANKAPGASDVEPEQHDVAVLHDVVLAFLPHLAGLLGRGFPAETKPKALSVNRQLLQIFCWFVVQF